MDLGHSVDEYFNLCEFEKHIARVHRRHCHDSNNNNNNSNNLTTKTKVAPKEFVRGFIGKVVPCFKMGVQEDSHEFLRLLIEAMQRSFEHKTEDDNNDNNDEDNNDSSPLNRYPLDLLRGTVESSVTCQACEESNVTLDLVYDLGLEVSVDNGGLTEVSAALDKFTRSERLDSQYR